MEIANYKEALALIKEKNPLLAEPIDKIVSKLWIYRANACTSPAPKVEIYGELNESKEARENPLVWDPEHESILLNWDPRRQEPNEIPVVAMQHLYPYNYSMGMSMHSVSPLTANTSDARIVLGDQIPINTLFGIIYRSRSDYRSYKEAKSEGTLFRLARIAGLQKLFCCTGNSMASAKVEDISGSL